jgi:LEA14-like dessication related protein
MLFALPALLLAVVACSGQAASIRKPQVELEGISASNVSLNTQTFMLRFDVENPNPFPIPISGVRYHFQVSETRFARGESRSSFTIPAGGRGQFDVTVEIDALQSVSTISSLLAGGVHAPIPYDFYGSLQVDLPLIKPVAFETSGVITLASN